MKDATLEARLAVRQRPPGRPALHMRWEKLLFLHWAWDAREIQDTLPPGLFAETFGGRAWLAIVPFFMRRVHPAGLPCVPGLSDFLELNVRTYVCDKNGRPGVWFYSLECNQPVAVALARRFFHLNYVHARMAAAEEGKRVTYRSQRRNGPAAAFRYRAAAPGERAEPGSLEFFLAERYVLFSADPAGRIHAGRVHHAPYEFARAVVEQADFLPAAAEGFADPGRPADHVMAAEAVAVEAWPLETVSGA